MIDEVAALLRDVARQVVLPRFRRLSPDEVTEKEPGELVTVADSEAERLLVTGLTGLLPGSVVVGEEAVSADPRSLAPLSCDGPVWVVDPVDGTGNFAAGRTPFAMMVALRRGGRTVAGWILDPVADVLLTAEAGAGAYLDSAPVRTRRDGPAAEALRGMLVTRHLPDAMRDDLLAQPPAFGSVLPGRHCAGAEYPAVIDGRQDFALFWRIKPWDHTPGVLILTEAGGVARHPDGTPYLPERPQPGLLIAANADIWDTVREMLFPA